MTIALYHGFTEIHFEMLGYFIEYIKLNNINIDIYAISSNNTGSQWYKYYETLFSVTSVWKDPQDFNPTLYDLIILLTDDDKSFKEEWLDNYGLNKVICIDHCGLIRRNNMKIRIGTRFFPRRPNCYWALPCYYGITKNKKLELLSNVNSKGVDISNISCQYQELKFMNSINKYYISDKKIKVLCIGIQNRPPCIEFLTSLFENFNNLEFHIIARFFDNKFEEHRNIYVYQNCPTATMFELAKNSLYILCLENPNNQFPIADSISGAITLAFSYGCQLILPFTWQQCYNFKSTILYYDNFLQKNGQSRLTLQNNINLDLIYDELYKLILHRNKTFDLVLNSYIKKSYNETEWYIQLLRLLNYSIPNIFIFIGDFTEILSLEIQKKENYDWIEKNKLKVNFRELHFIFPLINKQINKTYIDFFENYIFNHNNYNIIQNFNDSGFFFIYENDFNEISAHHLFTMLNFRNHKDIIIYEAHNNIDKFLNIYTRLYIKYTINDKIIVIPQF